MILPLYRLKMHVNLRLRKRYSTADWDRYYSRNIARYS